MESRDSFSLRVTVFARSRHNTSQHEGTPRDPTSDRTHELPEAIPNALAKVSPLQHRSPDIRQIGPGVHQLHYHGPFSLGKLPHKDHIIPIETQFDVELTVDRVPQSLPSNQPRPMKLALFDMDSTLINEEVIDELASSIGKADMVSAITARAMNGEIDFETSLRQRVAMLEGVRSDVWDQLKTKVTISTGAKPLIAQLKQRGIITGVISGGFIPMAEWLKGELGLDYAFANHLATSPSTDTYPYPHLTGSLAPEVDIVHAEFKRATLARLCQQHGFKESESMAVGDGSNDLPMLRQAGLGVAWNAKRKVQEAAPNRLNGSTMEDLIYLLS